MQFCVFSLTVMKWCNLVLNSKPTGLKQSNVGALSQSVNIYTGKWEHESAIELLGLVLLWLIVALSTRSDSFGSSIF